MIVLNSLVLLFTLQLLRKEAPIIKLRTILNKEVKPSKVLKHQSSYAQAQLSIRNAQILMKKV